MDLKITLHCLSGLMVLCGLWAIITSETCTERAWIINCLLWVGTANIILMGLSG